MQLKYLIELWENTFDHIYLQHYPIYKERFNPIINELKRVGIYDAKNFSIYYSIPNNMDNILYNYYKNNNMLAFNRISFNMFRGAYTNYRILNEAKIFEYKNILIIHDDIKFLKDLQMIYNIISNLPNDFDVCLFDYLNCYDDNHLIDKNESIENYYTKKYNDFYYSYNCMLANTICCYSKRYIDILIKCHEYKFGIPDTYISNIIDDYNIMIELGINIYDYNIMFCNPRLAIQYQYKSSLANELFNCDFDNYDQYQVHPIDFLNKNIDYSMYNV